MLRASICAIRSPSTRLIPRRLPQQQQFFFHSSHQTLQKPCPNCARPLPSALPACNNCWSLFALPKDESHHELLGIPYGPNPFVIDIFTLKRKFREAQSVCHPDSWASKNPDKQDVAQALSARVNNAYQTLLHPLSRIEYILEQNNNPLSETDQVQDMEFMAEIMEAREEIDDATGRSQVEALLDRNSAQISETITELENLVQAEDWKGAKGGATRLRYLSGIQRAAQKWLDNN